MPDRRSLSRHRHRHAVLGRQVRLDGRMDLEGQRDEGKAAAVFGSRAAAAGGLNDECVMLRRSHTRGPESDRRP